MADVEFWYDFASTYSYPAAMRVDALAAERGVAVAWRPFLLGPLFAEQGWRDSPFNIYPAKGRYMWRDVERVCAALGLPLRRPDPFPQKSVLAARVALALDDESRASFSRAVYRAEFGEGRPIAEAATLSAALAEVGADAQAMLARLEAGADKGRLRAECERAMRLGLPGAPCLVVGGEEIFWGNDRLEQGLDWAIGANGRHPTGRLDEQR